MAKPGEQAQNRKDIQAHWQPEYLHASTCMRLPKRLRDTRTRGQVHMRSFPMNGLVSRLFNAAGAFRACTLNSTPLVARHAMHGCHFKPRV